MKKRTHAAIAAIALFGITSVAFAEVPQNILLQIEPGYNPNHVTYLKEATVVFNGKRVAGGVITSVSDRLTSSEKLHKIAQGKTLTVDATFSNSNGTDPISCSRTWTAVSQDNLACEPIEVVYQPYNDSCVLVCN